MKEIQKQLSIAIVDRKDEDVRILLEQGADPNGIDHIGWTPLMVAAEYENTKIIKLLFSYGAEINRTDKYGQTPLHIAVDISIDGAVQTDGVQGDESIDIILCLLEHGADITAKDNKEKSPLDWAYEYKSEKIIKLLQEYKS